MARKRPVNHPWAREKGILEVPQPIREYRDPDGTRVRVYPPGFAHGVVGEWDDETWGAGGD